MASPTFPNVFTVRVRFPRARAAQASFGPSQLTELGDSKLGVHPDKPTKENASFSLSSQLSELKASHNPL